MGSVTNICKKDERADFQGEYQSTNLQGERGDEKKVIKGKHGKFSDPLKEKEEINSSNFIENSVVERNNQDNSACNNRLDESKNESVLKPMPSNTNDQSKTNNNNTQNNVSNMFNNSFTNNNVFNNDYDTNTNNFLIHTNEEKMNLRNDYVKKYTTLNLLKAEEIAGPFNKDDYIKWSIPSSSIEKITAPSLQLKEEIFSIEEENHSIYYGQKNSRNQKHGFGVLLINTGEKYEGFWENDCFKPYGRFINIKGEIHEGNFDNNKLNGKGRVISLDKTYEGSFFYGLKNGIGKEVTETEEYEGEFKNDKKDGTGKLTFKHSSNVYEGDFKDGKLTGSGVFTWKGGDKYVGNIVNGVFEGKGKYFWKDGNYYEGNYENGIRKGLGIFKWKDGRIFKGEFDDNVPHGNGILIDNGQEKPVRFNKGNIVRKEKEKNNGNPESQLIANK